MLALGNIAICFLVVALLLRPLGSYMTAVFSGIPHLLSRPLGFMERAAYRLLGVNVKQEMHWREYTLSILVLSAFSIVLLFLIFISQGMLPLNPQKIPGLSWHTALNAAVSFATNTNWQSYTPESAMSYFSQSIGIVVQMFLSPAVGFAVAVALCRAFAGKQTSQLGNCWVDITRAIVYILLPLSIIFAFFLVSQGVVMNYSEYTKATTLEGAQQLIAQGPVAFQTAIKMIGTNGGGFFVANAAHPFENPTPLSNMLQMIAIFLLPAAFVYSAGMLMRDRRQGWMMLAAMTIIFLPLLAIEIKAERHASPKLDANYIDVSPGNLEGKEMRFGVTDSAAWSALATATGSGSANDALNSHTPNGILVPMLFMQLGEVVYGGIGSGFYGMMIFVLFTVFIAGLMVGRTPEYLGKKLGVFEIKMASIIVLTPSVLVLLGTAIAVSCEAGRIAVFNPGPRGFSEILYAFTSAANNNGSALGGLNSDSVFYNVMLAFCMLIGRYAPIVAVMAIAGSVASKNTVPFSAGTLPTHTPLFVGMLASIVVIIGVLTYVPALALGPVIEHVQLWGGK